MSQFKKLTLFLGCGLFVNACMPLQSNANDDKAIETLYSFSAVSENLEIGVKSSGCTKSEDFSTYVVWGENEDHLSIVRTKPDRCRRMPMIKRVIISVDPAKLKSGRSVVLDNPVAVPTLPFEK